VIFDVPVFKDGDITKIKEIIKSNVKDEGMKKLSGYANELYAEVKAILKKYGNPFIEDQINFYLSLFMCAVRGMVINDAVEAKKLIVPETAPGETVKCNIGLYVDVNLTEKI